jgi:hypothetical protein
MIEPIILSISNTIHPTQFVLLVLMSNFVSIPPTQAIIPSYARDERQMNNRGNFKDHHY